MATKTKKSKKKRAGVSVQMRKENETHIMQITITPRINVGVLDGYITFWSAGQEVRIGPLTPEQALELSDDLGYEAVV